MTPQERSLIEQVAGQLAAHPLSHKDADADTLIQEQISSQPDALYRMTQVQIIQQMTLDAAQRKLADLQQQLQGYQQQGVMGRMFGMPPRRTASTVGARVSAVGIRRLSALGRHHCSRRGCRQPAGRCCWRPV